VAVAGSQQDRGKSVWFIQRFVLVVMKESTQLALLSSFAPPHIWMVLSNSKDQGSISISYYTWRTRNISASAPLRLELQSEIALEGLGQNFTVCCNRTSELSKFQGKSTWCHWRIAQLYSNIANAYFKSLGLLGNRKSSIIHMCSTLGHLAAPQVGRL